MSLKHLSNTGKSIFSSLLKHSFNLWSKIFNAFLLPHKSASKRHVFWQINNETFKEFITKIFQCRKTFFHLHISKFYTSISWHKNLMMKASPTFVSHFPMWRRRLASRHDKNSKNVLKAMKIQQVIRMWQRINDNGVHILLSKCISFDRISHWFIISLNKNNCCTYTHTGHRYIVLGKCKQMQCNTDNDNRIRDKWFPKYFLMFLTIPYTFTHKPHTHTHTHWHTHCNTL